ncbi:MAG: glutamyl-tRNA reductase, partial [Bacillota bacterium]|nr:glutamyl-tRNA reductase [Bacillota bacterium]
RLVVVNRTYERACQLAQEFGGQAVPWENLREALVQADIVISSTGAPQVVLEYELVREVMWARRNRPLFLIDIAVPRDIDPRAHELDGVYLYNIDDLQAVVEANLRKREQEVVRAEQIIAEEVRAFSEWWAAREVVPLIRALKERGREIQQQELEKLFKKMPHLSEREKNLIATMSHVIVNKLLHHPVVFLKEIACEEDNARYLTMARNLFNLELIPEEGQEGGQAAEEVSEGAAGKAGETERTQSRRSLYVKGG